MSLIFSNELTAQVIIKEKVEINPKNTINKNSINETEHIFTYTMTWTPSEYNRGNIQIVTCNNDTLNSGWSTSGSTSISFPGNGSHHYYFQEERWFYHNYWGWGWYWDMLPGRLLQVFIDDINLNQPQDIVGTYNGVMNNYDLKTNGSLCPDNYADLSIKNISWNECNVPSFYYGDAMSINIIGGSEFAVLFDKSTGAELGSTTQLSDYSNISNVGIKRIENAPKVQTIQSVKVESNINGVKDTSEIYYFPEESEIETEIYPEAITIGEHSNIHVRLYNYCTVPFETKINLMIIKGSEYGSLIDPYTNKKTKTLTNLDNWWGNVWVDYIANGKSPLKTDSVIIRISTSDSTIVPKELTFYINPSPIYVYTNPETVAASDTAEVIIKKRNPDGTLEDFPAEQIFELAVLDGCVNGNILVGDSPGVYFSDAQQPIYFVAADSVSGDSGAVRLRVGTDLGNAAMQPMLNIAKQDNEITEEQKKLVELRVGYEKMIEKKKIELNQTNLSLNEQLQSNAPITEVCYVGGYLYETGYWEGDVVVGNVCATLPKCTENNAGKKPNFEIMDFPNGTDGNYVCNNVSGITFMLWSENEKKLFLPIEIENCYDENANVIQFGIKNDLITLRAIVTACEEVIVNQGYTILYNTTELKTKVPQNLRALSQLYSDLDIFLDYFINKNPSSPFYPIELTWEHEFQHKKNYINEIFNVVNKDFDYLDYSRLDVSCGKYGNMNDVVDEMKYNFGNKFLDFETKCITKQFEVWGKKDGTPKEIENYKKNEIKTHKAIAKKVILALQKLCKEE